MQDSPFRDEGGGTRLHLKPYAKTERQARTWRLIGGILGLASGLTACLFGTVFAVLGWLATPGVAATYLQRYSTVLFILVIPLLLFGAHCLDLQDRKKHPPP